MYGGDVNDDIEVGEWNMRTAAGIVLHRNIDKLNFSIFRLSLIIGKVIYLLVGL